MKIKLGICLLFGTMMFFASFSSSQMVSAEPEFSDEFGSSGTTDGKFRSPAGLALDTGSDKLYVVDTDNDRIQIIDVNGDCDNNDDEYLADDVCFVEEFGGQGTGNGKFSEPTAVVLDTATNLLYIADTGNDRIQIIDVEGNCSGTTKLAENGNDDVCFVEEFGTSGNDDGEFDLPSGLALDTTTDYLYIADTDNNRIQIIDVDGTCDNNDDEYLADDVCFIDKFGTSGSGDGKFKSPTGLALHTDSDLLFIADTDNHKIQIIDVDGDCSGTALLANEGNDICFVEEFGGSGTGNGKFKSPLGLTLDISDDMLYVVDTDNERIQIIDVEGNCSGTTKLAESGSDDVCFVEEFGDNGNKDGEFESPSAAIVDSGENLLYVSDSGNNRIQILELSGSGSDSSSNGAPSRPTGIEAYAISTTSIFLTWDLADQDENVTGYKIESREGSDSWKEIISNTGSNANSFVHGGLDDGETYQYRIYAINSKGESSVSTTIGEKPEDSKAPAGVTATAISDSKIKLSWFPPSDTFKQSITGYLIERQISTGVYDEVGTTGGSTTTFTVDGLQTDKAYTYVVKAKLSIGSTPRSNAASATPTEDSYAPSSAPSISIPGTPNLSVKVISEDEIELSWSKPSDGGSNISGYKIEFQKTGTSSWEQIDDFSGTSTSYVHKNLETDKKYTYKVYAVNAVGKGNPSNEVSEIPTDVPIVTLRIQAPSTYRINEEEMASFTVTTSGGAENVNFSLNNGPDGAKISPTSGSFTWTPTSAQIGSHTFEIIAKSGALQDTKSITIDVRDIPDKIPDPPKDEPAEPKELGIASFVDELKDPQSYVDRYNNEPAYKKWFDDNYSEYDSIFQAVGLEEKKPIAAFVDSTQDPQYYVDRYNNEPAYKKWFDENFSEYNSIYEAVGLDEEPMPDIEEPKTGNCGKGTELVDGVCTAVDKPEGGGCLIATAAYGSEMAPQVQFLREIRDNKVMSTDSGTSFMTGFNQFYYSFSPVIADYQRENPVFKEAVKIGLTPMLSSLSILSVVDVNSEQEMLGYGIAIIMANIGMYFVVPTMIVYGIKKAKLVRF